MPSKKPLIIDGLASVRAVRRTRDDDAPKEARTRPSRTRLPEDHPRPSDRTRGLSSARIGHTAIPVRRELLCYECGYGFVAHGKIHQPICPKCHRNLCMDDMTIAREWQGTVRTLGNVHIRKDGTITGGHITARDILIEGDASAGTLVAGHELQLGPGATFDISTITFSNLVVKPGARISLKRKLVAENVDVEGEVRLNLEATGLVKVHAGGFLKGTVKARHLIVEDGGGLKAKLKIEPEDQRGA